MSNSKRMIQKVVLTENKRAEIIYPSNITVEDIRLIQVELDKIYENLIPPISAKVFQRLGKLFAPDFNYDDIK